MQNQSQTGPLSRSAQKRGIILLALLVLIGIIFALIDLSPSLAHMQIALLAGPQADQNYALAEKIRSDAGARKGSVTPIATTGPVESIDRLLQADTNKSGLFALAQDILYFPQADKLELIARIPQPATLFLLGPDAARIHYLADLQGMHIGIGPAGSASALIGKVIFGAPDLSGLNLTMSEHPFNEQLEQLFNGTLAIGLFVMPKDSPLIKKAVQDGLKIISFDNLEAIASRTPGLRAETLYAGHFDHVKLLPPENKQVLLTDTLILGNRQASRSDIVALLVLLNQTFHQFIDYNRNTPNHTGLMQTQQLKNFLDNNGPNLLDEYAPGLLNFMPPANILHYLFVVSVLLNLLTGWNKLRLYLLDSRRSKLEEQLFELFGRQITFEEIKNLDIDKGDISESFKQHLDESIANCVKLREQCRKYVPSFVTPLGQEIIYRFHETLISDQLNALQKLRQRIR